MTVIFDPTHERWTEADLADRSDDGSKIEIIDGSLFVTPPADEFHQGVESALVILLHAAAPSGSRVRTEIGLATGDDRFEPDVAVLRADAPRGQVYTDAVHFMLVAEVESRSTRTNDRGNKLIKYAEAGIPAYWRVERSDSGPIVHLYELPPGATEYKLVATVRPGETHTASQPFRVTVDPLRLLD